MAPGAFSVSTAKDTRPVRDRTYQTQCQRNIHEYLQLHRFPMPISPKTLTSPTQKEFQSIFKYLISEFVDPNMIWGKKFEDDCIAIMKDIRYPAMETLGKTALVAPGTPHTWPAILAMLNWLVDLCKVCTYRTRLTVGP
jgi:kinetochore protein NDC80